MDSKLENQLKENKVITEELLKKIKNKTYSSGRKKKVGDTVLYGFIETENTITLYDFHVDELGTKYIIDENSKLNIHPNVLSIKEI